MEETSYMFRINMSLHVVCRAEFPGAVNALNLFVEWLLACIFPSMLHINMLHHLSDSFLWLQTKLQETQDKSDNTCWRSTSLDIEAMRSICRINVIIYKEYWMIWITSVKITYEKLAAGLTSNSLNVTFIEHKCLTICPPYPPIVLFEILLPLTLRHFYL